MLSGVPDAVAEGGLVEVVVDKGSFDGVCIEEEALFGLGKRLQPELPVP